MVEFIFQIPVLVLTRLEVWVGTGLKCSKTWVLIGLLEDPAKISILPTLHFIVSLTVMFMTMRETLVLWMTDFTIPSTGEFLKLNFSYPGHQKTYLYPFHKKKIYIYIFNNTINDNTSAILAMVRLILFQLVIGFPTVFSVGTLLVFFLLFVSNLTHALYCKWVLGRFQSSLFYRYINNEHFKSFGPLRRNELINTNLTESDFFENFDSPGFKVSHVGMTRVTCSTHNLQQAFYLHGK